MSALTDYINAWNDNDAESIVAEWRFDYRWENADQSFEGLTIATVRDEKIAALREYATTTDLCTWEGEWK